MAGGNQTRRILVKVDTTDARGLREVAQNLGLLNDRTKSLAGNMRFLTNAFKGWLGFLGVRELARMSDQMQNLTNRLRIFTGTAEGARDALGQIAQIADRTNQGVGSVGGVYSRLAISLRGSNASTEELRTLTESLINTFRVAGATTTETTNTIIQLSQAFASGELRGQELRSVMEQNATLANLLRERFGQDIYKKAQQGAISVTEVLRVLAENQKNVNQEAKNLTPTIEQTLTKSLNKLSLSVNDINQKFQLSAKFAAVMEVAVDNLGNILIGLSGVVAALAVKSLPLLISQMKALVVAAKAFAVANPILLALTAITTVGVLVYNNWDSLELKLKSFRASILEFSATIYEYLIPLREKLGDILGFDVTKRVESTKKYIDLLRNTAKGIREEVAAAQAAGAGTGGPTDEENDRNLRSLIDKIDQMSGKTEKVKKLKEILGELNKEFLNGSISINEYNERLIGFELTKVNREFSEGKTDIFKYHEQLRDLEIKQINREFAAGALSIQQFNEKIGEAKIQVLDEQLKAGKISLEAYNKELLKLEDKLRVGNAFQAGVQSYVNSIGTLSQNVAKGIEQTFGHLEKSFTDFISTGKFNFKDFARSVLDDLNAIIVRSLIIRPLAQGITSGIGAGAGDFGGGGGGAAFAAAKGAAFEGGGRVIPFAKGGIVDSPMAFTFGGAKRSAGIMGEDGPEAILPLRRGKGGELGVEAKVTPVTINIINQSGSEVQQSETVGPNGERQIEVLITNKVKEGIVNGKYDRVFKNTYGLNRKGS